MSDRDETRWLTIQSALHRNFIERAFSVLRSADIEPILIKGWAAVRYYPEGQERYPGDVDLCVAPEQFERANRLFAKEENSMPVDIHKGLRHLDTLPFEELLSRSKLIKVGETDVRVLADEDHLRVLCVHWLTDGGAYKEKLKDIHFLIEERAGDLDWDRCLSEVDERRRRWVACTILLSHKCLGTKIEGTPLTGEKELPRWLIKAVEKEWATAIRLRPVLSIFDNPKNLWQQFRKRIPPNPVQATVELGGDFDRYPRAIYQAADVFYRLYASFKRKRIVSQARGAD